MSRPDYSTRDPRTRPVTLRQRWLRVAQASGQTVVLVWLASVGASLVAPPLAAIMVLLPFVWVGVTLYLTVRAARHQRKTQPVPPA